jgi:hypothetical protein
MQNGAGKAKRLEGCSNHLIFAIKTVSSDSFGHSIYD